jgi:hypothetical protein
MGIEKPIIKSATVTLTLASGEKLNLYFDDVDQEIAYSLDVERDIWEAEGPSVIVSPQIPGPRRRIALQLIGRGPVAKPAAYRSSEGRQV